MLPPTLVLQLDALMAVAHDIPALHRKEHPGDGASGLGADDFLPIFIYVLVNSGVEGLAVQSVVLETLCDPKKMMGEAGQSCVRCTDRCGLRPHGVLCNRGHGHVQRNTAGSEWPWYA